MTTWRRRLRALVLATLYLAGGLGLPSADALLDHPFGAGSAVPRSHVEGTAGCREHADHCPLGNLLSTIRVQAGTAVAPPSRQLTDSPRVVAPRRAPTPRPPLHTPPSRAPPGSAR